jgi:predicted acetyltransferase
MLTTALPTDHAAVSRLISLAFGSPLDGVATWLENAGLHNFRVMRESGGDMPIACALRVPMGHFFGGRSIRNLGVAGVAVAPETRGGGLATKLMEALMREARADGFPLASLYPATLPLYRRVGFEQAGYWCEYRVNLKLLKLDPSLECGGDRDLKVRNFDRERDLAAVHACYKQFALQHEGMLDRGDYIWGRIFKPRAGEATGLVVESSGQQGGNGQAKGPSGKNSIIGYVFFRQERTPALDHDVIVSDMAATTPAAARRLLDMLSDFRSVGAELAFNGGPNHPFVTLLAEQKLTMKLREYWMLRVLDVEAALTQRGYNPHVACAFTLDVRDTTIPENNGPWRVEVKGGRAGVQQASRGVTPPSDTLTLDARALAALYSGFMTPQHLSSIGRLEGSDGAVLAAAAAFAGGVPSLQDMF